jgi:hypothetical protein
MGSCTHSNDITEVERLLMTPFAIDYAHECISVVRTAVLRGRSNT